MNKPAVYYKVAFVGKKGAHLTRSSCFINDGFVTGTSVPVKESADGQLHVGLWPVTRLQSGLCAIFVEPHDKDSGVVAILVPPEMYDAELPTIHQPKVFG